MISSRRTGKCEQGFTLIELLVVLLILGLVTFIGPPMFQRAVPALEAKAAARIMAAAFKEGRSAAVRDNREVPVVIDLDARTVRVGVERYPIQLSRHLALSLFTGRSELIGRNAGQIRFFPDGTSTGGRVALTARGSRYDVVVDWLTGLAAIKE
jgi:general secretion pathway protein H